MNWKLLFLICDITLVVFSLSYYILDVLTGSTVPHPYTWLIWTITQGTATWYAREGDGGLEYVSLLIGTILSFAVFVITLAIGLVNGTITPITNLDTFMLVAALVAIVVWWRQDQKGLLALVLVTFIDVAGYVPTYLKVWGDQSTENLVGWTGITITWLLSIATAKKYNSYTMTYVVAMAVSSFLVIVFLLL